MPHTGGLPPGLGSSSLFPGGGVEGGGAVVGGGVVVGGGGVTAARFLDAVGILESTVAAAFLVLVPVGELLYMTLGLE